ncbi:unnamed protein product [Effrenium voratum]|uniref:EGF-like domain-containing protein n=1 Tax=Effrenium voratum TaxID=2562239 RepID=A0AA36I1V7_9DINO|nr:unnamed protein product [Effrenium voratum]CAJ1430423.1 unnamed protein product [Effrenium voratum]
MAWGVSSGLAKSVCLLLPAFVISQCGDGYFAENGSCFVCSAGRFTDSTSTCDPCPPGKYISDDGTDWKLHADPLLCFECPEGRASNLSATSECAVCALGKFSSYTGATECQDCALGVALSNGSVVCEPCLPGHMPSTDHAACEPCTAGKFGLNGMGCNFCNWGEVSAAASESCTSCPAGTYVNVTLQQCVACGPGQYSWSGALECFSCFGGTAASNDSSECYPCPAGRYSLDEATECLPCAAGTYSFQYFSHCMDCWPSSISAPGSGSCVGCDPGWVANDNSSECVACQAGKYAWRGDTYCWDCWYGSYSPAASSNCFDCPPGRHVIPSRSGCVDCPAGKYSAWSGNEDCYDCEYVITEDRTGCNLCPPGRYLTGNETRNCTVCEPGRYGEGFGSSECQGCPRGRYSNETELSMATQCAPCPGLATETSGSTSRDDCILPAANQTFDCAKGKPCTIEDFQVQGLQSSQALVVKVETCEVKEGSGGYGSTLPIPTSGYSDGFNGYVGAGGYGASPGRRLRSSGSPVGFESISSTGSSSYNWTETVQAEVEEYRVCWCSGVSNTCDSFPQFQVDVGTMTVTGPFPSQAFTCVIGRECISQGPIQGLGLRGEDQLTLRIACQSSRASWLSVALQVNVLTSNTSSANELFFGQTGLLWSPPGSYEVCWCSATGEACSSMQASDYIIYLEALAAMFYISGPTGGEFVNCNRGQICTAILRQGGTGLLPGDRLSFMQVCGSGDFLTGIPAPGYLTTEDGISFHSEDRMAILSSEPGMFRVCWCRPDLSIGMSCDKGSDFNVPAGLFVAAGPYSSQERVCVRGQPCVVTDLRGVSLSASDKLVALSTCHPSSGVSESFPAPTLRESQLDVASGTYTFDLGDLPVSGVPDVVQLCWCGVSDQVACADPSEFTTSAATLYVQCAPGWYALEGEVTICALCAPGFYCLGGWLAAMKACPAGSFAPAGSNSSSACKCREGYRAEADDCIPCPAGSYKEGIGNSIECGGRCPEGTTSDRAASSLFQCYCAGDRIDINPEPGMFECTDLMALSGDFSDTLYAATRQDVFAFTAYMSVVDASSEALVEEIFAAMAVYLGMVLEAKLSLEVRSEFDAQSNTWISVLDVTSTEKALAQLVQSKLGANEFAAWLFNDMKGTALDGAVPIYLEPIELWSLQCPEGLGFPAGQLISGLADCKCPHGRQPASALPGLKGGCVKCPLGRYKSAVADVECAQCPTGQFPLTTLQQGAISYSSCTCSAGYVSIDPATPSRCQDCGQGFLCLGGGHRQACGRFQTTQGTNATSEEECLCAAGFYNTLGVCNACEPGRFKEEVANTPCSACSAGRFSGPGKVTCEVCPAGRYSTGGLPDCEACPAGRYSSASSATSLDDCMLCGIGKFNNDTGATSAWKCIDCVQGSTTVVTGAEGFSFCVRPDAVQTRECISGRVCVADGVTGYSLQDGHRMAIARNDCSKAKSKVANVVNNGISKPSTTNGTRYVWGDWYADFTPLGGWYHLCWCANIDELKCDNLNANFVLSAGRLLIIGPLANSFECVRGQDCVGLQPFNGYSLSAADHVRIQRDACGEDAAIVISPANMQGLGGLTALSSTGRFTQMILGFGTSDAAENDFHLQIDAKGDGYMLCWCATGGDPSLCSEPASFAVFAGRLRVLGPNSNQERRCAVGQLCAIRDIMGAGMLQGDRMMILSDCGRGAAVSGFPAAGILETSDGKDFAFIGNGSKRLMSVPGFFRMCFCRPGVETCTVPSSFHAGAGLLTASGPFSETTVCDVGSSCDVTLAGVGVAVGDQLWVVDGQCGNTSGMLERGFPNLTKPFQVEAGLQVRLGNLPSEASPGLYRLCWCPFSASCTSHEAFRAPGGYLQVHCPAGSFALELSEGMQCEPCTRGYYCRGGAAESARRISCAFGRTTLSGGAVAISACVCDRGYRLDAAGACVECNVGFYKSFAADEAHCTACQDNQTTYRAGSVSIDSCFSQSSLSSAHTLNENSSAGLLMKTAMPVPAVSFNLTLSSSETDLGALQQQLIDLFIASLSATARLDASAIQIDFIQENRSSAVRRLQSFSTVVFTIRSRSASQAAATAADLSAPAVSRELASAVQQRSTGLAVSSASMPTITTVEVSCLDGRSIPPGITILSESDCQCSIGFGYDPATATCALCDVGAYKDTVGNGICTRCPLLMSTMENGATSEQQCQCQAGLFQDGGQCRECSVGFYCPGGGQMIPCPDNATTISQAKSPSDCVCAAGYFFATSNGSSTCLPCARRNYKPSVGNSDCPLSCPTSADSEPGSVGLADCFCQPGYYASVSSTGQLDRCIGCHFQGLECRGGFEKSNGTVRVHAQPIALPGYFQSGLTTAVVCDVFTANGSICQGGAACVAHRLDFEVQAACNGAFGNACGEGAIGMLCGQCPTGWSRDDYPQPCAPCPADSSSQLAVGIWSDVLQKTSLNFIVAVMAATAATKGSPKLHTSMIRIGTQWLAACSVLTEFNLGRLPVFGWSEEQERMDQLSKCADENATDCTTDQQASSFPWPDEATDAMNTIFNAMSVMRSFASVEFSSKCFAESLAPGHVQVKLAAPGVYYLGSPLIAMMAIFGICALAAYALVPLAGMAGMYFNPVAQRGKKRMKEIKRLANVLDLHQVGLEWSDLEASGLLGELSLWTLEHAVAEPDDFITGQMAYRKPLATKMCLHKARDEPQLASLCDEVRLSWEEFSANPDLLFHNISEESLHDAIVLGMSPSFLETLVLRALAWKLRSRLEVSGQTSFEVVLVVAACGSAQHLCNLSETGDRKLEDWCQAICEESRLAAEEPPNMIVPMTSSLSSLKTPSDFTSNHVDIETLDFGLFTAFPRPLQLFHQCVPVFWVMLLAMWPDLLSKFLKMIWCSRVPEDDAQGLSTMQQRLFPNPGVICWSNDHFLMALIACLGLAVWCVGVPFLLFLRLWRLKDRQSPDNFRRYGYFIQGFEAQFWWWDIVVKRFDVGLMNLVTYTSLAADDKAKLLLFPILSGVQLWLCAWCQPFTNSQNSILDVLEMCLLSFRFAMFSLVSIMLIFHPSAATTYVLSAFIALLLLFLCSYFSLHVVAQFLRGSAADMEDSEEENEGMAAKKRRARASINARQNGFILWAGSLKRRLVQLALPLVQQSKDEQYFVKWSTFHSELLLVTAAERHGHAVNHTRLVAALKRARAWMLHFGLRVEKNTLAKALTEFGELRLDDAGQNEFPTDMLHIVCVLTSTSKHVPAKTPLPETGRRWKQQVRVLLRKGRALHEENGEHYWYTSPEDILTAMQRLHKLPPESVVDLVDAVQVLLHAEKRRMQKSKKEPCATPSPPPLPGQGDQPKLQNEDRLKKVVINQIGKTVAVQTTESSLEIGPSPSSLARTYHLEERVPQEHSADPSDVRLQASAEETANEASPPSLACRLLAPLTSMPELFSRPQPISTQAAAELPIRNDSRAQSPVQQQQSRSRGPVRARLREAPPPLKDLSTVTETRACKPSARPVGMRGS